MTDLEYGIEIKTQTKVARRSPEIECCYGEIIARHTEAVSRLILTRVFSLKAMRKPSTDWQTNRENSGLLITGLGQAKSALLRNRNQEPHL